MVNSWVSPAARSTRRSLLQFLFLLFLTLLLMAASASSNSQPPQDPALKVVRRDRRSRICGLPATTTNSDQLHDHHHHLQQEPCTPQTPSRTRTRTRLINSRSFQGYIVTREMIGSSPPTCRGHCGRCAPCRAIHVPIQPGKDTPLEYYPEAWRCKCGNRLFMP